MHNKANIKASHYWPFIWQSFATEKVSKVTKKGITDIHSGSITWQRAPRWRTGHWFNIKMSSYQYRKSHCGDKTILPPSYLHNGISYTGKMASLYWIRVQVANHTKRLLMCFSHYVPSMTSAPPADVHQNRAMSGNTPFTSSNCWWDTRPGHCSTTNDHIQGDQVLCYQKAMTWWEWGMGKYTSDGRSRDPFYKLGLT